MSRTISSSTTGPVVLATTDDPLYITSTGTVTSTGSADGIDGGAGTTWTISNAGVVSASSGNGVSLASAATIGNTGSISGNDAVIIRGGGSVTNNIGGSISGLGPLGAGLAVGAGVYITGGTGTVTNHSTISGAAYGVGLGAGGLVTNTSSITGGEDGVTIRGAAGTIANYGSITATVDDGIGLFAGGSVTNATGASIAATGTNGAGIFVTGGVGTVANAGMITGPHNGVAITAGGTLSNAASGAISAQVLGVYFKNQPGMLTNAGNITATGAQGTGFYMEAGGRATNVSTGTITGHKFGAFFDGGLATLTNYGSISGATYDGVVVGLGGTVTNAANASISGLSTGVYIKYRAAGTVTNSGSISGTGAASGTGIDLADGGGVTNNLGGSITGVNFGVFATGAAASVANGGSISSSKYGAVELVKGGSVTNSGSGSIKGGSTGVYIFGASGTVSNTGTINAASSTGAGAALGAGGSVTNNAAGSISGGSFGVFATAVAATLSNSGSISGAHGVGFEAGGSITNGASASISGQVAGVFAQGGAATLTNAGSITASAGGAAADIEGGGSISNLAGATISGGAFGIFLTGGSGTVTNAGTISGGSYAIDFAGSGTNRLIVDPGAVFVGGVTGGSGTSTLELASGTGSIGGVGTGTFNHFQVLAVDAGATWTLNGTDIAPTVLDNGTLVISGSLDVSTAVDAASTGLFQLGGGARFEVAADTGTATQISFQNNTGELIVDNAALFGTNVGTASYAGPQLQDFAPGDQIDLKSFSSTGVTLNYDSSTGLLQVSNSANQVASFEFQTSTLGGTSFAAVSDGGNGIIISDPPSVSSVTSIATSGTGITNGTGDLDAGRVVTLTVNFSSAVNVNTTGGAPTLALNDGGTATYAGGSGTNAIVFSYTVASGQNTPDLTVVSLNLNGATIQGGGGNNADLSGASNYNPPGKLQIDTIVPAAPTGLALDSSTDSGVQGDGITNARQVMIDGMAEPGSTVTLYDGTTVVGTGTADATTGAFGILTSVLANGTHNITATATDSAGNVSLASTAYAVTIDATAPTVASIVTSGAGIINGTGDLGAGAVVTFTVNFSSPVNVNISGGAPTLALNDGGTASYTGGSGSTALTFSYTVLAGQNTPDLTVSSFSLNGATISDVAANNADVSGATNYNPVGTLQIETAPPTVSSITTSGPAITNGNGDLDAGHIVTFTVNFSGAVVVDTSGGSPTLTLNDVGTATYSGGSGSAALTFSYTVLAGQNTSDLIVSSFDLNGATVMDGAGNVADLSAATNYNPAGTLQIDTIAPAAPTGLSLDLATDSGTKADGITNFTQVKIDGAAEPGSTVTLYDSNGTTILGTGTADATGLFGIVTSVLANGTHTITATATDAAGNISGSSSPYTVTIDTAAPTVSSIVTSGPGISNGTGDLDAGHVVTLTVNFSVPVTVNTAGGTPTLTLNDGGTATYTGGSGTAALTFSYTVLAGQNTSDLVVSSLKLNGATIADVAANNANLSGATNYNPIGTLQIDTTAPAIAINTIAGNNIINATKAASGFTISGSTSGVENGQIVTVDIMSGNTIVDMYTTADNTNAWSVSVTSAQATALADGSYTVTANVSDKAGNPAPTATHALTVDEDRVPEPPILTVSNTSLTVQAGGSVALGITATPVDSDDRLQVQISGLPSYEVITAPSGDTVSSRLSNGTFTWTITESSSAAGTPLTGLTLTSHYTGTGHPVATLSVTASNVTSGETARSASQTVSVTDPPATTSTVSSSAPSLADLTSSSGLLAGPSPSAAEASLMALLTQYMAAGFGSSAHAAGLVPWMASLQGALGDEQFLVKPRS